ncbi:MAG: S8 family serine peptidase [Actinobacteria bacterium]|nr:S8 family serine peptidase [Actinomycetota bacterium]
MNRRLAGLAAGLAVLLAGPALAVGTAGQQTWHADQAGLPGARAAGQTGSGVMVAVLDSWVDGAHPDFEGRVLPGADCLQASCKPGPAASDACDHGTHVAGTVASSSFGVAPGAQILPVRVLSFNPSSGQCVGRPDDVAAGIRWAVENGARVINLSLGPDVPGLSVSSTIPRAVEFAARAGVLVVFSAGNASLPIADSYGGSALIVAATGPSGELATYSQRGTGVDLAAPGGDPRTPNVCTREDCVTSLFPGGRYSVAAGTSMAAPHVSGVAALLFGQDPTRSRDQVVARLLDTARPLENAGRGRVDAQAAVGASVVPATQPSSAPAPVAVPPPAAPAPAPAPAPPVDAEPAPAAAPPAAPGQPVPLPAEPLPAAQPPAEVAAPAPTPQAPVPAGTALLAGALVLGAGVGTVVAARSRP